MRRSPTRRRTVTFTVDQALNSVSNIATTLVAASVAVDRSAFGSVALLLSLYVVLLNVARTLTSEVLLVVHRPGDGRSIADVRRFSLVLSIAVGVLGVSVAGATDAAAIWFLASVGLPLMLKQDLERWIALVEGQPGRAIVLDLIWLTLTGSGLLAVLLAPEGANLASWSATSWLLGGMLSGVVAFAQPRRAATTAPMVARGWRHLRQGALRWRRNHGRAGLSYLYEFGVGRGAAELIFLGAAAYLGVAELGDLRLSQSLFGPLGIVVAGVQAVALRETTAALGEARHRRFTALAVAGSILYGLTLFGAARALDLSRIGPAVASAAGLIPIVAARRVILAATMSPWVALRAEGRLVAGRLARTVTGVTTLVFGAIGIFFGTARLVMLSLTVASLLSLIAYEWFLQQENDS